MKSKLKVLLSILCGVTTASIGSAQLISADQFPSIQAAIDSHPGEMIMVPNGDHLLTTSLRLMTDGSGLYGPGRIIQQNPNAEILRVDEAKGVRIKDLTLTRPEGAMDSSEPGLFATKCTGLEVDGVHVLDNRSGAGSIRFLQNTNSTIRNCSVENYKTVTVDDRTSNPLAGYAFKCIDGTGIVVYDSTGTLVLNNHILEYNLLPTKETRDKYDLGAVTILPKEKGELTPANIFETKYTNNWHQGSGLVALNLGHMRNTIISGNYIENAAQGIDIHSDYVVVSNNIVHNAMIGMKAMHGSKHVLVTGNQFSHVDLWGFLLQPGSGSHYVKPATDTEPAIEANIDGGTVLANNIFSDFGYGYQFWNWVSPNGDVGKSTVICIKSGQLKENPPLRDVLITGNVVYDAGKDEVIVDGKPQVQGPRYTYALFVDQEREPKPVGVRITNNILNPGTQGASNVELPD